MRSFVIMLLFLWLLSAGADAQDRVSPEHYISFVPQAFVLNAYGGLGNLGSTQLSPFSLGSGNPANLVDTHRRFLENSLLFASRIDDAFSGDFPFDAELKRLNSSLPQSLGLVIPAGKFYGGISFYQEYSASLRINSGIRAFRGFSGGLDMFDGPLQETYVYRFAGMAATAIPLTSKTGARLAVGLQISAALLGDHQKIPLTKAGGNDLAFGWKAGVRLDLKPGARVGISFSKGTRFSGKVRLQGTPLLVPPDSQFVSGQQRFVGELPDQFSAGILFFPTAKLGVGFNFTDHFWSALDESFKNQAEYSGSLILRTSPQFSGSLGFLATDHRFVNNLFNADYRAVFLSVGAVIDIDPVRLESLLADSHLFSAETRRQTLVRLGLGLFF